MSCTDCLSNCVSFYVVEYVFVSPSQNKKAICLNVRGAHSTNIRLNTTEASK